MANKHLYSIPETAEQIGMGITKTRELIESRAIMSVRIGTAVRIPAHAIEDFVSRLQEQS